MQDDDYNSVRCEYVEMLENQIAKSNNGIVRTKLLTFGVNVDDLPTARARLERVEADICGNFKKLGVKCRSLSGLERLELLHGQLHPGSGSPFRFSWDMIPKTGLSTKDFIAPDSFDFRFSRLFRVGTTWGAASYLQILASELSDKLLAELLEMDAEMTITLHIQTVDQAAAVKSIKAKVSDIDKMKVEEQKKAARSGYDMDILPPDLVTYSNDAKTLLEDLQSRNERMFLLTFLVVNMAPTRRELDNDLFTVSGIVQKYNCTLKRLDFQQEDGFLSSLPLGHNGIEIKRGMTTSSTAIFVPFIHRPILLNRTDLEIVMIYNAELRGLCNYYAIASNFNKLVYFGYLMEYSCLKTLANKHRSRISKVRYEYRDGTGAWGVPYETKKGKRRMMFAKYSDCKGKDLTEKVPDLAYRYSHNTTSFEERLKAKVCEVCGCTDSDSYEIHHVNKVKNLKGKADWEKVMLAKRRKTIVVCHKCHMRIHHGTKTE